jgi:hypothetical protein
MLQFDNTGSDPARIEAGLDRDRADLAGKIDSLRDSLSVDALVSGGLNYASANMAPYVQAVDSAVRRNPLAAVMAGAGLAWLVLGRRGRSGPKDPTLKGSGFEALSRWEDEGGPVGPLPDPDQRWLAEADSLRHNATAALRRMDPSVREQHKPAADVALGRVRVLSQLAQDTRRALRRGLEAMAPDAQDRIVAAREHAYAARLAVVRSGRGLIEDHPMIAGSLGLALGAALAAALPVTEAEHKVFGQERDRLLRQAERHLHAERARAARVTASLADTLTAEVQSAAIRLTVGAL